MNNNDDIQQHYDPELPDDKCDELLNRYFEKVSLPHVDTVGTSMLAHIKILQDGLIRSRRRWRLISVGTIAACVAIVFSLSMLKTGSDTPVADKYAENVERGYTYNEMIVPTGQRMTLVLSDGTKLIANSRSHVRYPTRFVGDTRNVWIAGEVYFDVAKDTQKPFIVSADGFKVQVYGTTFNISNYDPDDADIVLAEGSVAVTTDGDERVCMRPGHMVSIRDGAIDEIKSVNPDVYTSWTQGGLILDNLTLGDVADRLSTYYDVDIEVDSTLNGRRLYGCLDLKSDIDGVLTVLSSIIPMTVESFPDENAFRLTPIN